MVEAIQHDGMSGAATVAGSAAKGGIAGASAPLLIGVGLLGLLILPFAIGGFGVGVGVLLGAVALGAVTVAAAPVWGAAALAGLGLGALFGVHKVHSENRAFNEQSLGLQASMPQPQPAIDPQAIYQAGMRDGAVALANEYQVQLQKQAQLAQTQAPTPAPAPQTAPTEKTFQVAAVDPTPNSILEATPVPQAAQAQPVVHHFEGNTADGTHVQAVHATEEDKDGKRSFTAMMAHKKTDANYIKQIIDGREAANDPQFATARQGIGG